MKAGCCGALMLVGAIACGVLFYHFTQPPPLKPKPTHAVRSVDVYHPTYKNDELTLSPEKRVLPAGVKPLYGAVSALLTERKLYKPGVRLLDATVKDGVAMLNFSREMRGGHSTDQEEAILKSIDATVAQFPEVKSFQILIEGKPVETLASADLSEPIKVTRAGG